MTIDYEIINVLAEEFFAGDMPEELSAYLIDRYSEEPLEGDLHPQYFFPMIRSDIKSYIKCELDVTLRTDLEKLQDRYDELNDIVCRFAEDNRKIESENSYIHDFINYMNLNDKFYEFVKHAHVETDEIGFEYYTL